MKKIPVRIISLLPLFFLIAPPALAYTAALLQTDKTTLSPNQTFNLTINLTSNDSTLGTDLVLTYDPTVLQPTSVTPGNLYPTYSNYDLESTNGTLLVSAVSDFTQGTTPNGLFATVTFTAIGPGESSIALAFDPEDSALSGVIPFAGSSENLLEPPSPLTVTVVQPNIFARLWHTLVSFFSFLLPR